MDRAIFGSPCHRSLARVLAFVVAVGISMGVSADPPTTTFMSGTCSAATIIAPRPPSVSENPTNAVGAASSFLSPDPLLKASTTAEWNSEISITFKAIDARLAKCLESDLTLFLDHYPLAGVLPIKRTGDRGGEATITYRLTRPSGYSQGWNELMAKAWQEGGTRNVTVGIGIGNTEFGYSSDSLGLTLGVGSSSWAWFALLISAAILAAVWRWSKLLQDRRQGPMSYSLSRLLLGCWVLTTISAVLLMVVRTGSMPSASQGGLVFMLGIGGVSTGLSALIDVIRKPQNTDQARFWQDFLNDADGLALHRLQVLLFNCLVLFIVWRDMIQLGTVTQIDVGWGALLGASALTYLFGKSGESNRPMI